MCAFEQQKAPKENPLVLLGNIWLPTRLELIVNFDAQADILAVAF